MYINATRDNEQLSLELLRTKLSAVRLFNEILILRDISVLLRDQIRDYHTLVNAVYSKKSDVTLEYQQHFSQRFAESVWAKFLHEFDRHRPRLADFCKELIVLQDHYKRLYLQHGSNNPQQLENDYFYKKIARELSRVTVLIDDIASMDVNGLLEKANHILSKRSKEMPSIHHDKRSEVNLKNNNDVKIVYDQIKERDVYLVFRQMIDLARNMAIPLMHDLEQNMPETHDMMKIIHSLSAFIEKIGTATSLDSLDKLSNDVYEWKSGENGKVIKLIERILLLKEYLYECGSHVVNFRAALGRYEMNILPQIKRMKREIIKNPQYDSHHLDLLIKLQRMIETRELDDLDEIEKSFLMNEFEIKKIHSLHPYLYYLRALKGKEIDMNLLSDLHIISFIESENKSRDERFTEYKMLRNEHLPYILEIAITHTIMRDTLSAKLDSMLKGQLTEPILDVASEEPIQKFDMINHSSSASKKSFDKLATLISITKKPTK